CPLRRPRRREAQARSADRQGVRGVPVGQSPANVLIVMPADGHRSSKLGVSVVDGQGRPFRAPGLGRWLETVAPARARGEITLAFASDARVRALNRTYRGVDTATDVLSFTPDRPPGSATGARATRPYLG